MGVSGQFETEHAGIGRVVAGSSQCRVGSESAGLE